MEKNILYKKKNRIDPPTDKIPNYDYIYFFIIVNIFYCVSGFMVSNCACDVDEIYDTYMPFLCFCIRMSSRKITYIKFIY